MWRSKTIILRTHLAPLELSSPSAGTVASSSSCSLSASSSPSFAWFELPSCSPAGPSSSSLSSSASVSALRSPFSVSSGSSTFTVGALFLEGLAFTGDLGALVEAEVGRVLDFGAFISMFLLGVEPLAGCLLGAGVELFVRTLAVVCLPFAIFASCFFTSISACSSSSPPLTLIPFLGSSRGLELLFAEAAGPSVGSGDSAGSV